MKYDITFGDMQVVYKSHLRGIVLVLCPDLLDWALGDNND